MYILLVEDSPSDTHLLHQTIIYAGQQKWQISQVRCLSEAVNSCTLEAITLSESLYPQVKYRCRFDVVLLDLNLADSTGLDTVKQFCQVVPDIPVIVLTSIDDEELALQALAEGAQDYLVKDHITAQLLSRAVHYAIQRGKFLNQMRVHEQHIRNQLTKEKELNQLLSDFVAMISHEFRAPMSIIRTSADLLENAHFIQTEEHRAKYFQRIQKAINQMVQLLEGIFFLSQVDGQEVIYQPAPLNLESFCQELIELVQISADSQYRIVFRASSDCSQAEMDENLLTCILTNLLSNAIKYSPVNQDIFLDVVCDDGIATFRVQDQGIGIPLKDQPHLFKTFYRARNVGRIQGTGLGLAIVKKYVQLHQGEIQIESQEGVGTTVIVKLPMSPSKQTSLLTR